MDKKQLKEYSKNEVEFKRLSNKIDELRLQIDSIKAHRPTNLPRSHGRYDFTDKVNRLVDLQKIYEIRMDKLIEQRIAVENAIGELDDPIERTLMGLKYVDGLTWEEVCLRINYGWDRTHYYHKSALAKLEKTANF